MKHMLVNIWVGVLFLLGAQGRNTALIEEHIPQALVEIPGTPYAWQESGLTITFFEISGGNASEIGSFQTTGVEFLGFHNNIAIVGGSILPNNAYFLLDLSNQNVSLINTVTTGNSVPVAARGPLVALSNSTTDSTTLIDISDPLNVVTKGTMSGGVQAEFHGDDFIVVSSFTDDRVDIFDISNPDAPFRVSSIDYPRGDANEFANGFLGFGIELKTFGRYLAVFAARVSPSNEGQEGGYFFFDTNSPSNPQLISEILPSSDPEEILPGNFTDSSTFFFATTSLGASVQNTIIRVNLSDPSTTVFEVDTRNIVGNFFEQIHMFSIVDGKLIFSENSNSYRAALLENQNAAPTFDGKLDDWEQYQSFPRDVEGDIQDSASRLDIRQIFLTNDTSQYYLAYWNQQAVSLNNGWMLFINASGQGAQNTFGYPMYGERADYMIRNNSLFEYTGNSNQVWRWKFLASLETLGNGSTVEFRFPRSLITAPNGGPLRLKFFGDNSFYPNGFERDIYPNGSQWFDYSQR